MTVASANVMKDSEKYHDARGAEAMCNFERCLSAKQHIEMSLKLSRSVL